jgi:hypothetical protein
MFFDLWRVERLQMPFGRYDVIIETDEATATDWINQQIEALEVSLS